MKGRRVALTITNLCSSKLGILKEVVLDCEPWASATFEGQKIEIAFTTAHPDPDPILRDLPEAEIAMGNSFVADIRVVACDQLPEGWYVALEALVIDLSDA